MAVSGEEVMTVEQFAHWFEDQSGREGGAIFRDELRREVARRRGLPNFRQLKIMRGCVDLEAEHSWNNVGPFTVLVRPFKVDMAEIKADLVRAAMQGDLAELVRLLEEPLDPSLADPDSEMSLCSYATANGFEEVVRCLLEVSADPDKADVCGHTPLQMAAQGGHQEVMHCLLEAGANPDKANNYGSTPLLIAAARGNQEIVRCLLQVCADTHKVNEDGHTPLHVFLSMAIRWLCATCLMLVLTRTRQMTSGSHPCTMLPRMVMRKLCVACWQPVLTRTQQTTTGVRLCI